MPANTDIIYGGNTKGQPGRDLNTKGQLASLPVVFDRYTWPSFSKELAECHRHTRFINYRGCVRRRAKEVIGWNERLRM